MIANGDSILIRGTVNSVHADGTCYVVLPTGQSLYTDVRNCEPATPVESPASHQDDGLERKKMAELVKVCQEEGIEYQPSMNKHLLIAAIRAKRA